MLTTKHIPAGGNDLHSQEMSIGDAKAYCASNPACLGFTFGGPPGDQPTNQPSKQTHTQKQTNKQTNNKKTNIQTPKQTTNRASKQ
jgi:hypothetical protein